MQTTAVNSTAASKCHAERRQAFITRHPQPGGRAYCIGMAGDAEDNARRGQAKRLYSFQTARDEGRGGLDRTGAKILQNTCFSGGFYC
jgi:hypothetical protein